jgi:hypothetical protein
MYIFGGDRHLMAFNDLYSFDLAKGIKSLELYNNNRNENKQASSKDVNQDPKAKPTEVK